MSSSFGRTTSDTSRRRIGNIDVLRGLSILAVIFHHINLRASFARSIAMKTIPSGILVALGSNGYYGVILFFGISGFLITSTCLARWQTLNAISLKRFYRLRLARIVPLLVLVLTFLSILHILRVPNFTINPARASLGRALIAAVTFHVNWLEAYHGYLPANWDVLWSLSNEEVFYIFFPLLCIALRDRRRICAVLLVLVIAGPMARTRLTRNELWASYGYLSCMDVIAIGCMSALVARRWSLGSRARRLCVAAGATLVSSMTLLQTTSPALRLASQGLDVTCIGLGTGMLCVAFCQTNDNAHGVFAPLRWFGRNSYEIYLTHMMVIFPVLTAARRCDPGMRRLPVYALMITIACGVLGAAIARWYSEPMRLTLSRQLPVRR